MVAGNVDPGNPFDRLRCVQAGGGRSDADPGEPRRGFRDTTGCTVTCTIDTGQPGHAGTLTVRDRHAVQRVEQARPACWPARGQCRGEYVAHGLIVSGWVTILGPAPNHGLHRGCDGRCQLHGASREREGFARMRATRQQRLTSEDPLILRAVITEAVLRREVGGPDVMRDQARWLVEVATLPNVTVQVLPFSAGAHPGRPGHSPCCGSLSGR